MDAQAVRRDGRHARVDRSRDEIVQSLLAIIHETGEMPSAEVLAERAKVSRRSVFRVFDDREDLLQATTAFMFAEVKRKFGQPGLSGGTVSDRTRRLVDHLADVYEYVTPVRRVSERQKAHQPLIREQQDRMRRLFRQRLEASLPDALPADEPKRRILLDALQLIASWNAWVFLRYDLGRSVHDAKAAVAHGLESVLRPAAEPGSREPDAKAADQPL